MPVRPSAAPPPPAAAPPRPSAMPLLERIPAWSLQQRAPTYAVNVTRATGLTRVLNAAFTTLRMEVEARHRVLAAAASTQSRQQQVNVTELVPQISVLQGRSVAAAQQLWIGESLEHQ